MQSEDIEYSTGAHAALAGYWYQLKVSVLFALDVLARKQEADQITLEPATREDLETELTDEPGALTQRLTIRTRKLVVQCKLRNTVNRPPGRRSTGEAPRPWPTGCAGWR